MAGHSRWANIRHRKERADAKKGKLFSRLIKEVAVAARIGGADIESNPRLRLAVDKARVAMSRAAISSAPSNAAAGNWKGLILTKSATRATARAAPPSSSIA